MGHAVISAGGGRAAVGWTRRFLAIVVLVGGLVLLSAALPHTLMPRAAAAGVCNQQDPNWANRDADGDGVCNAVDMCPYDFNPPSPLTGQQDPSACAVQAVTVPASSANPNVPHLTYSGAAFTLKGIARYGATQFSWDFGDGTAPTPWTAISNPQNLGVTHVYTGAVGRLYLATLSVRSSPSGPTSTATYPVSIAAGSDLSDPAALDSRASMAIDQALWWLHTRRSLFTGSAGAPYYSEPMSYWASGSLADTCVVVDTYERLGITPNLDPHGNPYVDDVRQGLSWILSQAQTVPIGPTAHGNPDVSGDGFGIRIGSDATGVNGACALAVADSGTPARRSVAGPLSQVFGRTYGQIVQDMVDYFAWSQSPSGPGEGGWDYSAGGISFVDGDTTSWPARVLDAAARRMGATVPPYVRAELAKYVPGVQSATSDATRGGFRHAPSYALFTDRATGEGLRDLSFLGLSASAPSVQNGLGFLYRHWNDPANTWTTNLGWTDAMARVSDALTSLGVTRLSEVNPATGQPTGASFDWYYTPPGQSVQGYGSYLVTHQDAPGSWTDVASSQGVTDDSVGGLDTPTAFGIQALASHTGGLVNAAFCGPSATTDANAPITLDGTCSSAPPGHPLRYAWSVDGNPQSTSGSRLTTAFSTYTQSASGAPTGVTHQVCLTVSDAIGDRSYRCTGVIVRPGPACPTADTGGPYRATVNQPLSLDASASSDRDGDPLTYAWDFHNNGAFTDASGAKATTVFASPGTYLVAVQVTDHPEAATPPYSATNLPGAVPPNGDCSAAAYTTVVVAGQTPIANAGGPYYAAPNSTIALDGSASSDPGGLPLIYRWDLSGDGMYSDSSVAQPTFTVGNVAPGTEYPVCLRVSDGANSAIQCSTVLVRTLPLISWSAPPAAAYGTPLGSQLNAVSTATGSYHYTVDGGTRDAAGQILPAGQHTLTVTFTPDDPTQYAPATKSVPLTVTPALLTVTADPQQRTYGAANPAFTDSVSGFVNGDTSSVLTGTPACTTTATSASTTGTYPISCTAGTLSAGSNYALSFVPGSLTVSPASLSVTADPQQRAYGAANPAFTDSVSGFVNGDSSSVLTGAANCVTTATPGSDPGSYPISCTAGTLSAGPDYALSFAPGTLTVSRAPLTVTADPQQRAYGAANPALTSTISGLVNGDTSSVLTGSPSCVTTATPGSDPGTYPISCTAGTLSAGPDYVLSFVPGVLTVLAAPPAAGTPSPSAGSTPGGGTPPTDSTPGASTPPSTPPTNSTPPNSTPPTPTTGPSATATLTIGRATGEGGAAHVPLSCTGSPGTQCVVTLRLVVTELMHNGRIVAVTSARRSTPARRILVLASATETLQPGQHVSVQLTMSPAGAALLRAHPVLHATLIALQSGRTVARQKLDLKLKRH